MHRRIDETMVGKGVTPAGDEPRIRLQLRLSAIGFVDHAAYTAPLAFEVNPLTLMRDHPVMGSEAR